MPSSRSGAIVGATLLMARSQRKGAFVVAESDADGRMLKGFLIPKRCQIVIADGKYEALKALRVATDQGMDGVLATVDSDFDELRGKTIEDAHVACSDGHDVEAMIMKTPALDKLLRFHGSEKKLEQLEASGKDVRTILISACRKLGYLRMASLNDNLGYDFDGISFRSFIDKDSLELDINEAIKTVLKKSQKNHNPADVLDRIQALENVDHDPWMVCCGHDLVEVLSLGLCKLLGSCNSGEVTPEKLERELRLGYESSDFMKSRMAAKMRAWEEQNPEYPLFN